MITIYKTTENGLEQSTELASGIWINVINPDSVEIEHLSQTLHVPQDYLTYPLDIDERARTEAEDGMKLIILRIPYYEGPYADIPYTTMPLGIVVAEDFILTICKAENGLLRKLTTGRLRGLNTNKRNRFVLHLLLTIAATYLNYLREIDKAVDIIEDQLQLSMRNNEVLMLLKYQKSLTMFTTALKSNELVIKHLHRSGIFTKYPDDEDLLEDVLTEVAQAIEMTTISSGILSQMMDAFASIISNNLNVVMKFLTSFTIILSIPTLIASIYGMNVKLPFDESAYAFALIMVTSFGLSTLIAIIFARKHWL